MPSQLDFGWHLDGMVAGWLAFWPGCLLSRISQLALANFLLISTPCFYGQQRVLHVTLGLPWPLAFITYVLCVRCLISVEMLAAYLILTYLFLLCTAPHTDSGSCFLRTLGTEWVCAGQVGVSAGLFDLQEKESVLFIKPCFYNLSNQSGKFIGI